MASSHSKYLLHTHSSIGPMLGVKDFVADALGSTHPILLPYHFSAHWSFCPPTSTDPRLHPWSHKSNLPSVPSGRGDNCNLCVGHRLPEFPRPGGGGEWLLQSPTGAAGLVMHRFWFPPLFIPPVFLSPPKNLSLNHCLEWVVLVPPGTKT